MTNVPGMYDVVTDWSQYTSYYQSMHTYYANGDTTGFENAKSQLANEVVNAYLNDGDDSTNIDYEGAMSFVEIAYTQYSDANPVEQSDSGDGGNTVIGGTGQGGNFNISAPTGMTDGVVDWGTYDTQMQVMHNRLSGNNEVEALEMRQQMATSIMDAYNSDDDETNDITMEQALSYVDARYYEVTKGTSIIDSIQETTKSAKSFWNYVPIVNCFIDDTTEEDLYKMMEGKEANTADPEGTDKAIGNAAVGTTVAAVGTYVGICVATGSVAAPGVGTLIGAGVGLVVGLVAWGIDFLTKENG